MNYLNLGCGNKFHKDWTNVDMNSNSEFVIKHNLLNSLPFINNEFDVVYHSQVLEHFPKEKAEDFIKECYRVLKPNGIIRIVVPDLENITKEYLRLLNENIVNPTLINYSDYQWILLEMYDQTVRNVSGGQMAEYLKQKNLVNESYVLNRIGFVGSEIRNNFLNLKTANKPNKLITVLKKIKYNLNIKGLRKIIKAIVLNKEEKEYLKIGEFRKTGEIHYWMYDKFSLSKLLESCNFKQIQVKTPFESRIPNWSNYELDVKNNQVFDPNSLFMEAIK